MKYSSELGVAECQADQLIRLQVLLIFINAVEVQKSRVKTYD